MALTKVRTAGFDHGQKGNSLVNTGTILPHGSSTAPTGFLSCDGSAVSRTTYADLFAVIGTTWGTGNGSSTFNLPDLRAAAIRGTGTHGSSTNGNTGAAFTRGNVGTLENDMHQEHGHDVIFYNSGSGSSVYREGVSTADFGGTQTKTAMIASTGGRSGVETRGFNASVLYVIKT
tara:strand:- start:1192 stop:1716 length:525 start_codon:yes stop_codon:yes gene_type:complete